jgi:hypothetical protein
MEPKRLPPHVLQILTISQLQLELARANHARTMAEVERDFGFRFGECTIENDGTIKPLPLPIPTPTDA